MESRTMTQLSFNLFDKVVSQASSDPGLPSSTPTISYWQLPPHPELSSTQSAKFPLRTDFAVIGSGVTGCSISKRLLESTEDATVTVFEARTLCSGASGRNGGGLATFAPYMFPAMLEQYGESKAIEVVQFLYRTLDKMHEIGNSGEEIKNASEIRRTRDIAGFRDQKTFEEMRTSFLLLDKMVPEANLKVEIVSPEAALKDFGITTVGGAIRFNCGAFWPYRFVTTLWHQLYREHAFRLRIETNTPVEDVTFDRVAQEYILETPRGAVRTKKLVHATNGYAGHLLPRLRGKIFPLRGFMSAQEPGPGFGRFGRDRTWSFFGQQDLDVETGVQASGVYYGNQSPNEDTIFWGSDLAPIDDMISADDSIVPGVTRRDLSTVLPTQFNGWAEGQLPQVKGMWSGTLGCTADQLPLVGEVPTEFSGRGIAGGEWICAGFNGAGMCQCWPSGEAVAMMMLDEDATGVVPELYLTSEKRFAKQEMSAEKAMREMFANL